MNKKLDVYLYNQLVGALIQDNHGVISFQYIQSWLNNPGAVSISYSLPLQLEPFTGSKCHSFFGGILPEYDKREIIARNLGVSARNDFAILERIGGECAGAITFLPSGTSLSEQKNNYKILSDQELINILNELPQRPLLAGEDGVRLSLAGAQDKIVVFIKNDVVMLPLNGAPSSHIIKPAIARFKSLSYNEAFCLSLSKKVGIPTAGAVVKKSGNIDYLLIDRYDRKLYPNGNLERLHQEDFCQALAIASENKYQNEGGPSLRQCVDLIRKTSSVPAVDLVSLIDAVVFNYLIGNNDAHGKNFSLLYQPVGNEIQVRFSPLYDLVSTAVYKELSGKMAMKIGEEYLADSVCLKDWEKFAISCGLSAPMVIERLKLLASKLLTSLNDQNLNEIEEAITKLIRTKCSSMLK